MTVKQILQKINIGSSVAEFDQALVEYFIETGPFKALTSGTADIVAGDKGTGKTAIFKILCARYRTIPSLKGVEVIPGFNVSGNPVFQRLAQESVLSEGQYASLWKAYIFSLVGNWLLEICDPSTPNLKKLDKMLEDTKLKSADSAPSTIFSRILNSIKPSVKSAQAEVTFSEIGIPIITPKIEFGKSDVKQEAFKNIPHEEALRLLNDCLQEVGAITWVVLDRLDEAFQGFQIVETPALRALLRTYLDLLEFDNIRLKLFVRKDLFRKVIHGGFVNLTHVNARKIEIVWDEDDLLNLLCQRLKGSGDFIETIGLKDQPNKEIFDSIFPNQIDQGERKSTSWNWVMSRIRDGNGVKPPRNLIDLVIKSREAQMRQEEREERAFVPGTVIIEADAIKRGLTRLSTDRVEDTLLAESGDATPLIEKFRKGKSEHNLSSLTSILGIDHSKVAAAIKLLNDIGFLESVGDNYKIPMLYRDGLEISQGKAF
jgi:hypothetical protein